ncbi:MAG: CDP-alcohol phosphatidyltransferase family protein [Methylohalobius sp.]|nr:CDP-alcohol phosphatidyltransferase family protein [Methylohalobius sp.]
MDEQDAHVVQYNPFMAAARSRIDRWGIAHAACLLAFTCLYALDLAPAWVLQVAAGISFAFLVQLGYATSYGLGVANTITLARLGLTLALPLTGSWAAGVAAAIWLLDGLDGFIARRLGEVSDFGDLLDKETDACFTLILGLVLVERTLPLWLLVPGALRYGFVLALWTMRLSAFDLPGLRVTRWIGSMLLFSLILGLTSIPGRLELLATATWLALFSFAYSFYRIWPNRPALK